MTDTFTVIVLTFEFFFFQIQSQASLSDSLCGRLKVSVSLIMSCDCHVLSVYRAVNAEQVDTYQLKSLDGQFG